MGRRNYREQVRSLLIQLGFSEATATEFMMYIPDYMCRHIMVNEYDPENSPLRITEGLTFAAAGEETEEEDD